MYLSIDFEDPHHDLKRSLGICESGQIKTKELWKKYEDINNFLEKYGKGNGKSATFFCTGVIAEKSPDLIHQISKDGHEIACHYFFHDFVKNEDNTKLYKMLLRAKNCLENASGKVVKGFRAPCFAINNKTPEQYKILEEIFDYDSSFHCNSLGMLEDFKKKMGLKKLKILPLYSQNILGKKFKLGGSFLKIFPVLYSKFMISKSIESGFNPHIYMHPYEFDVSTDLRVKFNELVDAGFPKALYWKIRQNQWLTFKNKTTKSKLATLIRENPLEGTLDNLI
tara:strand:- start:3024 stop:3866 length:843 start_codon:yes stop_codon:yes gene_type:complete